MRVDVTRYWTEPPPEPSGRLTHWLTKIRNGWRPNRRIRQMGYQEEAEFYGVYLWEYWHSVYPALYGDAAGRPVPPV